MSDQILSASYYIVNVERCLRTKVKAYVTCEDNDIVIRTKGLGDFRTTFDVWNNMLFGVKAEDQAAIIIKQYKHFIECRLFKY